MFINMDKGNKGYRYFLNFVIVCLLILLFILVKGSYDQIDNYNLTYHNVMIGVVAILFFIALFILKDKVKPEKLLIGIMVIAFSVRIVYACTTNSVPVSDFEIMFDTAGNVIKGDYSNFWGIGYIARFPHITVPVLYFALLRVLFSGNALLAIKIISVIASSLNCLISYLIIKEVFFDKFKGLVISLIIAIYPPLIVYTAVYTTENIAIPLYLLGIYLFIKAIKASGSNKLLFFAAMSISFANLFRMVGQVILVAFILYVLISYKEKLKKKIITIGILLLGFLIPLVTVSSILHYSGIIEFQLWGGSEPSITNIVKGLNIEYEGRWNPEDASIPEDCNFDYELIEKTSKDIIHDRLTNTPVTELFKFFVNKYKSQWSVGDFSGSYWAEHSIEESQIYFKYSEHGVYFGQVFHLIIMILAYIGLFNIKEIRNNRICSLFYYIFCGYGLLYLISENQARYGFIVCWIFVFMASIGIDLIEKLLERIKVRR